MRKIFILGLIILGLTLAGGRKAWAACTGTYPRGSGEICSINPGGYWSCVPHNYGNSACQDYLPPVLPCAYEEIISWTCDVTGGGAGCVDTTLDDWHSCGGSSSSSSSSSGGGAWCNDQSHVDCRGGEIDDPCGNNGTCQDNNSDHQCGCNEGPGECNVGGWVNDACGSFNECQTDEMRQVRSYTPAGCAVDEYQCVTDSSCRPSVCVSSSRSGSLLSPTVPLTVTMNGSPPESSISYFSLSFYNQDNPPPPGSPSQIIFSGAGYTVNIPYSGSNSQDFIINYADLDRGDEQVGWDGTPPVNIRTLGYFLLADGGFSSANPSCVQDFAVCRPEIPGAPGLSLPVDNYKSAGLTETLSWTAPAFWGTGCPANANQYLLYVEADDTTPDVLVATLGSGTTSYLFTGMANKHYYWRVEAFNGSLATSSVTRSFYTPGLLTGTLFDSSAIDNCALMGSEPKIFGATVNIAGAYNYVATTDVLGIYSQLVKVPGSYLVTPVVSDPPYITSPKLTCQGTSADFVDGGPGTITLDFGFWRIYGGWWQIIGGDVYGGGGIESIVPVSMPAASMYLILDDANGNGGLAQYDTGGSIVLENGIPYATSPKVSVDGWVAESGYGGQDINYEYYMAKMSTLKKTVWDGLGKPTYAPVDGYEIYTHTGDVTVNLDVGSGEKMIFMVDGNVTVDGDMTVAVGGHLTVIASGNTVIADNVAEVHGWWVADNIVIESTGDKATEIQFRGQGSFVGWDAVELNRDRGETNNTAPAEVFINRPDLMVNAPVALKFSRYIWREQVP